MHNLHRPLALLGLICLLFLAYFPGLHGDFEFDDQANLLQNTDIQIQDFSLHTLKLAALSGDSGPLGRPVSMITFAINHAVTGFDPFYLKLTNVAIHAVSGFGLYLLVVQLLVAYRRASARQTSDSIGWIALLVAAAWMLHPLNLTSILYIVQRMTSLSGLFSIVALYCYASGRNRMQTQQPHGWWLILIATPAAGVIALFCKENAAMLPLLIFLIEAFFFRFRSSSTTETRILHGIFLITLWLPLIAIASFLVSTPEWLAQGFGTRGFTLPERLMTESRVLWFYLRMIAAPDISLMGIYHDDIAISTGLTAPLSTLPAVLGLFCLVLIAILFHRRAPLLSFGIAWFLAGHLMESSIIPLEIAHEHRNYLPMIGPILAAFYYLLNSSLTIRNTAYPLAVLLIGMLTFSTLVRAKQWGDLLEHAIAEAENHPDSPRAQQQLGRMYFKLYNAEPREEFYEQARKAFEASSALDPHFKSGLYARIILDYNAEHTPPDSVITEFRDRLQHHRTEPGDITMLESLLQCQLSGDCKLPDTVFLELLEIEVERYKGDPKRQASFLSFLGSYAAQKMDDEILAGQYLKQAVDAYPSDVQGRLNYAWYLGVTGQYVAANAQIAAAWQADSKLNKFGPRIHSVERSIQERKINMEGKPR